MSMTETETETHSRMELRYLYSVSGSETETFWSPCSRSFILPGFDFGVKDFECEEFTRSESIF